MNQPFTDGLPSFAFKKYFHNDIALGTEWLQIDSTFRDSIKQLFVPNKIKSFQMIYTKYYFVMVNLG